MTKLLLVFEDGRLAAVYSDDETVDVALLSYDRYPTVPAATVDKIMVDYPADARVRDVLA